MATPNTKSIPAGSLVLVIGANAFLSSHVIKDFLDLGYRVRGTVRDLKRTAWVAEEMFADAARRGDFELVEVPDIGLPDAFRDAVRGVAAVVGVATPNNADPDPNKVVPLAIAFVVELLRTAVREPSIKQFVYTSTMGTLFTPDYGKGVPTRLTTDMWNNHSISEAWAPPPYEVSRFLDTYMASKTEAEMALWKFAKEEQPCFDINTVNPYTILGTVLHGNLLSNNGSCGWVRNLCNGNLGYLAVIPEQCYINVRDVSMLHVAAVLDPDVKNQRLLCSAKPFTAKEILDTLREIYPDKTFDIEVPDKVLSQITVDDSVSLPLLKKWTGRDAWISWDQTIHECME